VFFLFEAAKSVAKQFVGLRGERGVCHVERGMGRGVGRGAERAASVGWHA